MRLQSYTFFEFFTQFSIIFFVNVYTLLSANKLFYRHNSTITQKKSRNFAGPFII